MKEVKKWVVIIYNPFSKNFRCRFTKKLYGDSVIECLEMNKNGMLSMLLSFNHGVEFCQKWQKEHDVSITLCIPAPVITVFSKDEPFDASIESWYIITFTQKNSLFYEKWGGSYDEGIKFCAEKIEKGERAFMLCERFLWIVKPSST